MVGGYKREGSVAWGWGVGPLGGGGGEIRWRGITVASYEGEKREKYV